VPCFFEDICTPAEIEALVDRWQVAGLLYRGMPYRAISEKTGVSVATVTRVARFLFNGNSGYKIILERIAKK
jgi:TrpR-related protein YerC/YecD